MQFDHTEGTPFLGELMGYVIAGLLFSTTFYAILYVLNKVHTQQEYLVVLSAVFVVSGIGLWLRRVLR